MKSARGSDVIRTPATGINVGGLQVDPPVMSINKIWRRSAP